MVLYYDNIVLNRIEMTINIVYQYSTSDYIQRKNVYIIIDITYWVLISKNNLVISIHLL
jgi:hypothetical protein